MTVEQRADVDAERIAALYEGDAQFRAARPLPEVVEAVRRPGLRLVQVLQTLLQAYGDRPAVGVRASEVVRDPATGRIERSLLPVFETTTYHDLWSDVEAIAAVWGSPEVCINAGDVLASIGFASADYLRIDLACAYLGLVSVPLQHNSPASSLRLIFAEIEPRVVAAAADYLDLAVNAALSSSAVRRVVVFDYQAAADDHRRALQQARNRLADRGIVVELLGETINRGRCIPVPSPFDDDNPERLAMILYTSGSTGVPKGAMWTERMLCGLWTRDFVGVIESPVIAVNFMPLNHIAGRIVVSVAFQSGGVNYFVPKSDLSTLFEDWTLVRPTQLVVVPRVLDMLYQRHQAHVDRLVGEGHSASTADDIAKAELRDRVLGGRVLGGVVATAPLSSEMRTFAESCLQAHIIDGYGLTEIGGVTRDGIVARPPVIDYKLLDVPELGYFGTDRPYPRGELLVKTATAMPGYYKRPEVTAEVFDAQGYYRTGDVMAEVAPDHLVYVDRRNNVLKLAQGEFVALAHLEAIYAGAAGVRQIYVHGNSERSWLLAVIVPTEETLAHYPDENQLKAALHDSLLTTGRAAELQSYEVPVDFFIETEPFTIANGLLSGVGKILRPKLKEHYGQRLEELYTDLAQARSAELRNLRQAAAQQPTLDSVMQAAQALLASPAAPSPRAHFTELGGDSLSALNFSTLLTELFSVEVPVGVIIGPSTDLASLAAYIEAEQASGGQRPTSTVVHGPTATSLAAADLSLEKFLDKDSLRAPASAAPASNRIQTVLLTGANGYLGRFLMLEWLKRLSCTGGRLIALVRGADPASARRRLEQALNTGDPSVLSEFRTLAAHHLDVLVGDVTAPRFGLDEATWQRLAHDVDVIVHTAALVNHVLPYRQLFGPNVVGTAEVIRLAISERIKPVTYLSTVAVAMGVPDFTENGDIRTISPHRRLEDTYANGYANSKWAGEVLLREANDYCGLPVSVFRCDLLLAHSRFAGQLNVPDAFTRLLISLLLTGVAPRTFYADDGAGLRPRAHFDGLPADFVAEAVTTIGAANLDEFCSYDVMNPHDDGISLDVIVDWLIEEGAAITRLDDHAEWLTRFEGALRALPEQQRRHSALALLEPYRVPQRPLRGAGAPTNAFRKAVKTHGVGQTQDIPHINAALIHKYLADLTRRELI